jgi:hypothetical protein
MSRVRVPTSTMLKMDYVYLSGGHGYEYGYDILTPIIFFN